MKKLWKENKDFIILGLLGMLAFILVLIFLWPEKDKIIQAELIVILVCMTGYYAIQTQELVKREKIAFEDQIKKRSADFGKKLLEEFYTPFKLKLMILDGIIKLDPNPLIQVLTYSQKIIESVQGYGNMITKETNYAIIQLLGVLSHIKDINVEDKELLLKWKETGSAKSEEAIDKINMEIKVIEKAINEVYGFFINHTIEKPKF